MRNNYKQQKQMKKIIKKTKNSSLLSTNKLIQINNHSIVLIVRFSKYDYESYFLFKRYILYLKMLRQIKDKRQWDDYHLEGLTKNFLVDYKNNIIYMPAYIRAHISKIESIQMNDAKMNLVMKLVIIIDYTDLTLQYVKQQDLKNQSQDKDIAISDDDRSDDDNLPSQIKQQEDKYKLDIDFEKKKEYLQNQIEGKQLKGLAEQLKIQSGQFTIKQLIINKIKQEGITILKDQNQEELIYMRNPYQNKESNQFIFEQNVNLKMDMAYEGFLYPFQLLFLYTSLEFREFRPHQDSKWRVRFNLMKSAQPNQMIITEGQVFLDGFVVGDKLLHIQTDHYSIIRDNICQNRQYYLERQKEAERIIPKTLSLKTTTPKKHILYLKDKSKKKQQQNHQDDQSQPLLLNNLIAGSFQISDLQKQKQMKKNIMTDNYGFANIVVGVYKKPIDSISIIFIPLFATVSLNLAIFSMNNNMNERIYSIVGVLIAFLAHMNTYRSNLPYTSYNILLIEYLIYLLMITSILALGQTIYIHFAYTEQEDQSQKKFKFTSQDPWFTSAYSIIVFVISIITILFISHYFVWQKKYTKYSTASLIWKNITSCSFWYKALKNPGIIRDIFKNILNSRKLATVLDDIVQNRKLLLQILTAHQVHYDKFTQFDIFCWQNQPCEQFFKKKEYCKQIEPLIPIYKKNNYFSDSKSSANHFSAFHPELQLIFTNGKAVLKYIRDVQDKKKKISKRQFAEWMQDFEMLLKKNRKLKQQNIKNKINEKHQLIQYLLLPKNRASIVTYEQKAEDIDMALQIIFDHNPYVLHAFDYGQGDENFDDQDLWQLLYILVKQAHMFHENGLGKLGNIKPQNIFFIGKSLKIRCKYSWPKAQEIDTKVAMLHPQYLAPEELSKQKKFDVNNKSHQSLAQAFSIGLSLLDIVVKTDYSRRFYNKENPRLFDEMKYKTKKNQLLPDALKKIKTYKLRQIIFGMCELQPKNRYSCSEIYQALKYYEDQILNYYYFESDNIVLNNKKKSRMSALRSMDKPRNMPKSKELREQEELQSLKDPLINKSNLSQS